MYKRLLGALALLCWCGSAIAGYAFAPPVRVLDDVFAAATAVGDVNADGRPDIVMLTAGPTDALDFKLVVYWQQVNGSYSAPDIHDFGWSELALNGPYLALADMDGDVDLDVVAITGDGGGRVVILRNDAGEFSSTNIVPAMEFHGLDISDVNGDGRLDVITQLVFSSTAAIFYGDGNGGFAGSTQLALVRSSSDLHLVDVDGDGGRDLVYATQPHVYMHRHQGQGFSATAEKLASIYGDTSAPSIDFSDLNGDGRVDIVADPFLGNGYPLLIYPQDQSGAFNPRRRRAVAMSEQGDVMTTDLNGDTFEDLLVLRHFEGPSIRLGRGDGTFAPEVSLHLEPAEFDAVADLNGDGMVDLLSSTYDEGTFVHFGRDLVEGEDLAIELELLSDRAGVRVENLGTVPSQEFWMVFDVTATSGSLAVGAIPAGCHSFKSTGRIYVNCSLPSLAPGGADELTFPFAVSSPQRRYQIIANVEIDTIIQDLRPDNDRRSKRIALLPGQNQLAGKVPSLHPKALVGKKPKK